MKKQPKTIEIAVIQQYYGQGWEDVSEYHPENGKRDKALINHDIKGYQLTGYLTRLIHRRIKNELI